MPGRGDELPVHALALRETEIDPDHLAAYSRVCGFAVSGALPATYLHVLAFPLAMALMTERSFPFALLGLVHVANRIECLAPLSIVDRPDLRVWAQDLRPHRRGRQFDLVADAEIDGQVVWRGRSTYLRPGGGSDEPEEEAAPGEEAETAAEADADGPAAVWHVPDDIGRRYAAVSGDRNPIHLHALTARPFGFRGAIAHGMWSKARCLAAFEGRLPDRHVVEVEFRSPLVVPAEPRFRSGARQAGWDFALAPADQSRGAHLRGSLSWNA